MPLTAFPNGVSSFGMPILGSGPQVPATTGNVFFVDSNASGAADGNAGTSPEKPCATIDGAIGKCTASNGDVIIVMPGHTESLTTAAQISLDVAGVSIIGLGQGHNRPTLVYDGASGSVSVTASNTRISNIVFETSIASVTNGVILTGAIENVEIDNCEWDFDATGVEFVVMLQVGNDTTANAADRVTIRDCFFRAENTSGCSSAIVIDDCNYITILRNIFTGNFSSNTIDGAANGSNSEQYVIAHNIIYNQSNLGVVDLDDGATGIVAYNAIGGTAALASNADFGACLCVQNYVADAADVSGVVIPTTAAT